MPLQQSCNETFHLPAPGQAVHRDFRQLIPQAAVAGSQPTDRPTNSIPACSSSGKGPIRLVQWNIERGYQLPLIIQQLRDLDADVISLQEVDWGCERNGGEDTGGCIAQALGLNYLFVCEFEELHSPLRDARSQGGGVHGNAILSKFDFRSWDIIEHSHHPIDWNTPAASQPHPLAAKEPRRGRRLSLAADVDTPQGGLRVYCCHLEVFCGILSRVWQFTDILTDAKRHSQQQLECCQQHQQEPHSSTPCQNSSCNPMLSSGAQQQQHLGHHQEQQQQQQEHQQQQHHQQQQQQQQQQPCHQVILGDLNTMAHGVARLSPNYCCDKMRWWSLGSSEAAWWQRHVLAVTDPCLVNKYLLQLGLPVEVAQAAVNPGFLDPFDVTHDTTLDNPRYRVGPVHLMAGKLDWVLLRGGCRVVAKAMGNDKYSASDHKWLMVDVLLV